MSVFVLTMCRLCYEATAVVVQASSPSLQHAAASMVEATKLVHAAAKAEIARLQESTKKVQEQVEQLSAKEGTDKNEAAGTTKTPQGRKNSLHEHDQAASSPASSGTAEKEDASIDRLRERANILSLITPPFHRLTPPVAPAAPRRPSAVAKELVPVPEQEQVFEGPSSDENLDLGDECSAEKFSTQDYIQWLRSKFDVALDEAPYIHPPADAAASQQVSPSLSPCLPPSLLALPCHSANARTLSRDCSRYASIHICPLLADLWLPGGSAHGL